MSQTSKTRKEKLLRFTFILNGFIFLMGGISAIGIEKLWLGAPQLLAGIFNLLMVVNILGANPKKYINYLIYLMNTVVAIFVCIDYIQSGTQYIQYVWMFVAVISLLAFLVIYTKENKLTTKQAS